MILLWVFIFLIDSSSSFQIFDGIFRALKGVGKAEFVQMTSADWTTYIDCSPTWSTIDNVLRGFDEDKLERGLLEDEERGYGPTNHRANIRLFDEDEGFDPEVTLFRDQAAWCPYCEKVWLQLEEKRIPYRVEKSALRCYGDKTPAHLRADPRGMLPVAIVKGRVISESNEIMQALEDNFPAYKPLLPAAGDAQNARVGDLLALERRAFSSWFSWLTTSSQDRTHAVQMEALLQQVNDELESGSDGPFFLGNHITLVDIMFTPFLERMAASLPYFKGFTVRDVRFPALLRWFEAMDARTNTYAGLKSDYYTHCMDLPPQIGRCFTSAAAAPFKAEIDGFVPSSLRRHVHEPMLPADEGVARRDAARRAVHNHVKLVRFAARGATIATQGRGMRAVAAPLADPKVQLIDDQAFIAAVDAALRCVIMDMLQQSKEMPRMPVDQDTAVGVAQSLKYLRERIGVPRDMSVHASQQMRQAIDQYLR